MTWEGSESEVIPSRQLFRRRAMSLDIPWRGNQTVSVRESAPGAEPAPAPRPAAHASLRSLMAAVGIVAGIAGGIGLVLYSFSLAEASPRTYTYTIFFFGGVALLFAPMYFGLWKARGVATTVLLMLIGAVSYVPEILRAPRRVYLGDELAHFGQAIQMYDTGQLFPPNPLVPVSAHYPGFELAINTLRSISGLPTYRCGTLLLFACHVVAVLGVYEIATAVTRKEVAVWVAAVFAISPQLLAFDSMFSYESLGLPLAIIGLAAASRATREQDRRRRNLLFGFVGIFVLTSIVTHHVSSFALLLGLFVLAVGWLVVPHPGTERTAAVALLGLSLAGTAVAVVWAVTQHAGLTDYLLGSAKQGASTLFHRFFGGTSGRGTAATGPSYAIRAPEGNSGKPRPETLVSDITPVVWFVLCGLGVWMKRRSLNATWFLVVALASSYFLLLPLIFVGNAQTAAHRSWAFSYIGLACVGVVGAFEAVDALRHRTSVSATIVRLRAVLGHRGRIKMPTRLVAAIALPALLALSAYGTGVNVFVQYPGPVVLGADGRSTPEEAFRLAAWFSGHVGPGQTVLSDAPTAVILYGMAREVPDALLSSEMLLQAAPVSPQLRRSVQRAAGYVVLNSRLLEDPSQAGYYVWPFEPPVPEPLPASYFDRLLHLPWLVPVYESTHYTVLKVVR
jgi:hypothetical protein